MMPTYFTPLCCTDTWMGEHWYLVNQIWHGGVSIPPILLGDGAYPISRWFMKPYPVPNCEIECNYNRVFNKSRNVIERAFGHLKSWFQCLSARIEVHQQNVNSVITSAVILHNICERKRHRLPEEELADALAEDAQASVSYPENSCRNNANRQQGEAVRRALAEYIFNSANQ